MCLIALYYAKITYSYKTLIWLHEMHGRMHPKLGLTTVLMADACMHDGPDHHWPHHLDIALATLQYQCCPGSIFDLCHK